MNNEAVSVTRTKGVNVRCLATTAMLGAVAWVLMFLNFPVPFMPPFIKFDFSDLPALIGTFSFGPLCGVFVCLIKNLINLLFSSTGGVGELSNFILGVAFVLPAGFIYRNKKSKKFALIGALVGMVAMGVISVFSNYFVVYPVYYELMAPEPAVIGAYQAIVDVFGIKLNSILPCLVCFNMPFTMLKGLCSTIIALLIYKPLSPFLKGRNR